MPDPTASQITIRPRHPSDVPQLIQILTSVYNLTGYTVDGPPSFAGIFTRPGTVHACIALHNDQIVGHMHILSASTTSLNPTVASWLSSVTGNGNPTSSVSEPTSVSDPNTTSTSTSPSTPSDLARFAVLSAVFVDPGKQGLGIGRALVDEALAWGRKKGKRLVLIVLEKDQAAMRMYERMGWERGVEYVYISVQGVGYRAFGYLGPVEVAS